MTLVNGDQESQQINLDGRAGTGKSFVIGMIFPSLEIFTKISVFLIQFFALHLQG